MSRQDIDRLHAIRNALEGRLKQTQVAEILGLSDRQVRRLCARVEEQGARGIRHGLRGRPSNHRLEPELLEQALSALHDPLWEGFGPTFAQDKLWERYGIALSDWTIRRWMTRTGLWLPHRDHPKHRAWRQRRLCLGLLVQLDGSDHDWFEGRGPRCVLLIYIDDATSRILYGKFVPVEDTLILMRATREYLRLWGLPVAFYVDKDGIYKVNMPATVEEELRGVEPMSQFTRAMAELGIKMIFAHSPQAKGRVERGFGTHQDRLVKELRLRGISNPQDANRYLLEDYIPGHNERYAVLPAQPSDAHRPLLASHDLDAILSIQEDRQVHNDSVIRFDNRFLLLAPGHGLRPKTKVVVQQRLDGTLRIAYQGRYLQFKEVQARPYVPEQLRRTKPKAVLPQRMPARLPPNPFYRAFQIGSSEPTLPPASAVPS